MNAFDKLREINPDKLPFWSIMLFAFPSRRKEYKKLIDTIAEILDNQFI